VTPVVLGVDPGGKSSGFVLRRGSTYLAHDVVTAKGPAGGMPAIEYLWRVADVFENLLADADLVAMETVTPPRGFKNGRRDAIQPGSLIGVSAVAGYLLAHCPEAILVSPAGNGSRPLSTYPPQLIGARESAKGTGILRHARSAWDVAGAARLNPKESA
jgi:hypothetical protein